MRKLSLTFSLLFFFTLTIGAQNKWVQLSPGGEFTVGLKNDGTIYTWGYNGSGQLGNGSSGNESVNKPAAILDSLRFKEVQAGNYHALALSGDSTIWAWGYNGYGQVNPDSDADIISTPVKVDTSQKWVKIYAGFNISYAVDTLGNYWVWGSNVKGEAGIDSDQNAVRKLTKVIDGDRFKQISCGKYFTLAVSHEGSLWGWGDNSMHTLTSLNDSIEQAPVLIDSNRIYKKVEASFSGSHALDIGGRIWSWGSNEYKESGVYEAPDVIDTLMRVETVIGDVHFFTDLECGGIQCFATEGTENDLFTWGTNNIWSFGQVGVNQSDTAVLATADPDNYAIPMASMGLDDGITIYGGHILMFESSSDYTTYCGVGPNYVGQIGGGMDRSKIESIQCNLGQSTVSNTSINYAQTEISIYPNPATSSVSIDGMGNTIDRIHILNSNGQIVQSINQKGKRIHLNLNDFSPGMYFVKTITTNGKNNISKLIVE